MLELALTGEFKESHEKKIRLKTYSTKAVQQFIRFLYGFELEQEELKKDLQLAKDLTVMGGVYNIPSLQKAAAEALVDHVNMDNLVEIINPGDSAAAWRLSARVELRCLTCNNAAEERGLRVTWPLAATDITRPQDILDFLLNRFPN